MWRERTALFVPDFSGISLSFSPFNLMLAVSLLHIAFIIFIYVPYIPDSPRPLSWRDVEFCQRAFQHLMRCSYNLFSFSLFIWWITLIDFGMLNQPNSDLKLTWSLGWSWLDHSGLFFYMLLNLVCQTFIEYFCIHVHEWDCSVILFLSWVFVWF